MSLDRRRFEVVDRGEKVVVADTERPLTASQAASLRKFVRGGGGLVVLGGTLAAWSDSQPFRELA
jgi:hypothetical protein